jgi:RNA polymerase sigma-70 factor (ECF subfamily)
MKGGLGVAEMNLRELFARMQNGDREAFACIYQELKQPVYTICYRITQSKETAEDITHDVFVKLFRSPPGASVKNMRAWIFQMARNLSIDTLRKNARIAEKDGQCSTDDAYDHIHLRMDLEAALRKLPWDEREILTLHLNADLNFKEISNIVGLSLPATYRKYRKSLKTVQKELNGG